MKPRARRPLGLTLIELMIGLGIMAVLMSLAVPSYSAYMQRQRLKAAVQGLELDLREARYESARRNQPLAVVLQPGVDWCWAIATRPDCDCRSAQPCRLKTVRSADLRGVHLSESRNVRFDPGSGHVDAAGPVALLLASGDERVRVEVNAPGRPSVCLVEGTLAPFARC